MKAEIREILEQNTWELMGMHDKPNDTHEKMCITVRRKGIDIATEQILSLFLEMLPEEKEHGERGSDTFGWVFVDGHNDCLSEIKAKLGNK